MKEQRRVAITIRMRAELVAKLRDASVYYDESLQTLVELAVQDFLKGKRVPKRKRAKLKPGR